MKKIILTIDYEFFLGEKTGTVQECLIEPTDKLLSLLDKNNSKMTVFWDILQYYRLLELEDDHPALKQDRISIEKQILELARKGHDIQLHLHPHWLDARYENGRWIFTYERFKLHALSEDKNPNDINTILGCVTMSKEIMENLIREVNPSYEVTTFRAGGYLIEPFHKIQNALRKNGIRVDSSVCPNLISPNGIFSYNFFCYPNRLKYSFEYTPQNIVESGSVVEIPITTVKIPSYLNILFTFLRIIKYPHLEKERKGSGTGEYFKSNRFFNGDKINSLMHIRFNQLTLDSNFKEKFSYEFKRVSDYSTMIIHPKLLNTHTLKILYKYITNGKIQFLSIKDFLN